MKQKYFFRLSTAVALAAIANFDNKADAQYFKSVEEAHNPGEEHLSFDLVMKPYPIPAETTTYTDFFFNIPDDAPDLFHITYGEVLISQPAHLHHFVLTGCPEKIDESKHGVAAEFDMMAADCVFAVGQWAPGADLFSNTDLDTGVLLGRGMGIQSLQLNVHYTDGVYVNETTKELAMATDGIRVHYTPNFRPYTTIGKELINIGVGHGQLDVPPGESRFYVSRMCEVQTNCKDAGSSTLGFVGSFLGVSAEDFGAAEISCEVLAPFCALGGEEGSYVRRLCPATCGLCDGESNPFNPDAYRMTAIQYHAHLLGREMYTTLIRGGGADDEEEPETMDLQSREFWIFDNQETIPFEFENDAIQRGTEVRPGDKLQATCVYDSSYRTEPTNFYLSTYDEMCITTSRLTFPTPASLLDGSTKEEGTLDMIAELHLMSFACVDDERADVYSGILGAEEDGRYIWRDHPLEKAEGCTFPTNDFFQGVLTSETRNCPDGDGDGAYFFGEISLCPEDAPLLPDENAGAACTGGTLDGQDSNTGVSQEDCEAGGGSYSPYTCGDAESFLASPAGREMGLDIIDYLISDWWEPKCCGTTTVASENPDPEDEDVAEEEEIVEADEASSEEEASPEEEASSSARGRVPSVMATGAVLLVFGVLGL